MAEGRGQLAFYARHKAEVERMLDGLEREHPEMRVVRLRPGLIFQRAAARESGVCSPGPPARAVFCELLPVVPDAPRLRFQAVHSLDVGDAYRRAIVRRRARGLQRRRRTGPRPTGWPAPGRPPGAGARPGAARPAAASWRLRVQPSPPGWIDMALDVPLMDTGRARTSSAGSRADGGDALLELLDGLRDGAAFPTPPLRRRRRRLRAREILTGVGARGRI